MAYPKQFYTHSQLQRRTSNPLVIVGILWGLAAAIVLTFLYTEFGFSDALSKFYLMPWCLATAAVIVAPSVYMVYKGTFDPFHPLVFPAWSYFFPGFVIGGFVLASGISQPYFLSFIQDEHTNLPLTFVYVMLGYAGLTVGFVLPFGKKVGEAIRSWLPSWEWRTEQIAIPALLLFILGLANTILAFALGIIGFQRMEEIGAFDGLIFLFSLFWIEGCVLLWLYIFKSEKLTPTHYFILAVVLSVSFARVAFQGNRSGFIQMLVTIGFAFFVSQKKVTLKHSMIGGILVVLALFVGMIYGTAFRAVKGSHDRASLTQIADTISSTGERLSSNDIGSNLGNGLAAIGERIDSISSLAVVVSNYEALAPYEESYGMDNNIMNELTTFLIPRMIWKDKPISIEPSKYADLYFNFPDNSFAMTPMGDLLRNFGPVGVPIGMIILGIFVRLIYSALMEGQPFSFWRAPIFFMLMTSISYEGTYGIILPFLVKVLLVAGGGVLLLRFIIGRGARTTAI